MSNDRDWVAEVQEIGPLLAKEAERCDREGRFVTEAYALLKARRFFSMAVPAELGGGGARHRELCDTVRELGRDCGSTALAFSMHSHLVAAAVWRHAHGQPGEALLRKVAAAESVLLAPGALRLAGLQREEGRRRLRRERPQDLRKRRAGRRLDRHQRALRRSRSGPLVLHFSVPTSARGVSFREDWDTLGMRGTGSNTVVLERVFVPEQAISLRRPRGQWHPAWSVIVTVAAPIFMAAYAGMAEAASELALSLAAAKADLPPTALLAGELENLLTQTRLAWRAMVDNAADYDFAPSLALANRALVAKTLCANGAIATVHKAMELAGGAGFFHSHPLERMLRDVCAAPYHPLPEKRQLELTGLIALGRDPITRRAR